MVRRPYSRLAQTEEKKNVRQAFFFGILTLGAIIALFVFGLPTVAKFAAFLTDIKQTTQPIEKNDTTPPAPPQIDLFPEAINKSSLEISGTAEPGITVKLFLNGGEREILTDFEGRFSFVFSPKLGENKILAKAIDRAGNESQETEVKTLVYDIDVPTLTILSPEDGSNYYGARQRQVVIEGQTEPGVSLTINERFVVVEDNGTFSFATTLHEGENKFTVKAADKAGNEIEEIITLNFYP